MGIPGLERMPKRGPVQDGYRDCLSWQTWSWRFHVLFTYSRKVDWLSESWTVPWLSASRRLCFFTHMENSQHLVGWGTSSVLWFAVWFGSCYVVSNSMQPYGLQPATLLYPQDFPGKNIAVGSHCLLQGIFLNQGSNPRLLPCRQILYGLLGTSGVSPGESVLVSSRGMHVRFPPVL